MIVRMKRLFIPGAISLFRYERVRGMRRAFFILNFRVSVINIVQVLNGIKLIKLYAWEEAFEEKINALREQEVRTFFLTFNRFFRESFIF